MYTRQYPENTCVGANCNSPFHMGEFVIWAKYNVGELGCGRIAIRPYDTCKLPHTMPMTSFLCIYMIYMYICQCPDNTRVGANCNSPSPVCEQFTLQTTKKILKNKK